ncbi:MAG: DUF72 domain-containing protein [Hyphomonadaceae bacterium]|nr:DUF72 domain-containing protein [Hyphomonadaceae bacterium]MBP9234692.1 DUF72 domain-containing protein [Hyphomonadaceae bacterium]
MAHPIRVGVGGWNFEPWDETFYPPGLSKAKQLNYMSRKMTAIEVNATYYSSFKPETFAKWAEASPDGFVFSLKAHRFSTVRKTKEDMKKSVDLFLGQGITRLKEKLGPINWQFPGTRKFDAEYFNAFLSVLPKEKDKQSLRHALEVRGLGFDVPEFYDLLTKHGATVVYAEDDEFPKLRHQGSSFAVARLMQSQSDETGGYPAAEIGRFAKLVTGWSKKQDVFAFFISGAKERNPAAAMALQERLGIAPPAGEADATTGKVKAPVKKAAAKKAPAKKK